MMLHQVCLEMPLKIGFDGMLEVALFADILTLKEALNLIKTYRLKKISNLLVAVALYG